MNRGPDGRARRRRSRAGPVRAVATPAMCRQLVSAHIEQASMTTKPATPIQMYLDTTPAMQQAHAEQEPDRGLDHPALVVHPRIPRAHCLRELRILRIQRTLDLVELTLLVLRERHGASQKTSRAGTGAMTSSHGPGSSPEYECRPPGWKGSGRVKGCQATAGDPDTPQHR